MQRGDIRTEIVSDGLRITIDHATRLYIVYLKQCGHFCEWAKDHCCGCRVAHLALIAAPCEICRITVEDFSETAEAIINPTSPSLHKDYWNYVVNKGGPMP